MEPLLILAVLACPIMMGGMMLWRMLRMRGNAPREREDERR